MGDFDARHLTSARFMITEYVTCARWQNQCHARTGLTFATSHRYLS
jgi:hypothetical protein